MMKFFNLMKGFTLIELMVVISITAILGSMSIIGFVSYNRAQVLQTSANEVVMMLNLAKSRAQSQVKLGSACAVPPLEGYSVEISTVDKSYTLRINCPRPVGENLRTRNLPQNVSFSSVSSNSFFFPVQKGGVESGGQIVVSYDGRQKIINIDSLGMVTMSDE